MWKERNVTKATRSMRGITSFTERDSVSTNVEEVTISRDAVKHVIGEAGSSGPGSLVASSHPAAIRYARQVAEARTAHLFPLFRTRARKRDLATRRWFICPECNRAGGEYDNDGSWHECQLCHGAGICTVE